MKTEEIWEQYHRLLKRFIASKVSNAHDAEDLLQSILLKTHVQLDSLQKASSLKAWMLQIAQRTIVDYYRTRGRANALPDQSLWYEETDFHSEMTQCLKPFIQQLPAPYDQLLLDIELHATSQKDYAQQHQLNYSTVKSRVQKGRMLLKQLFEGCCSFERDKHGNAIGCEQRKSECGSC